MLRVEDGEWLDDQPTWPAFVDLLASSTLLFLTLLAVLIYSSTREQARLRAENEGKSTQLSQLLDRLTQGSSAQAPYRVLSDSQLVRVIIEGDVTFPTNQWVADSIKPGGRRILGAIGRILADPETRHLYRQVMVVGHTDQEPFRGRTQITNWELSAARAASVARFLTEQTDLDPCLLGATGRGPFYPDYSDTTRMTAIQVTGRENEAMRINRRIELEIIPALVSRSGHEPVCFPSGDGRLAAPQARR